MMFFKLWQRYIFKEYLKFVLFFLFGFYFLYVTIDFSIHMTDFLQGKSVTIWHHIIKYYALQFIKRVDILLPLGLLIGAIKVLTGMNANKELVALQSAGIPLLHILRPLFAVSLCALCLNLAINQFAVEKSLNFIDKFHDAHLGHTYRESAREPLHVLQLEDETKLVFQYYDEDKEAFFDVIWIKSPDELWRMKYLKADPLNPQGEYVDQLIRNQAGIVEKESSYLTYLFPDITWREDLPLNGAIPFENRSLSQLLHLLWGPAHLTSYQSQSALTQLLYKLAMPFLCLLSLIAPIPYCVRTSRHISLFLLYGLSIFGFVAFVAFMDAAVIIGENGTLSPLIAILTPFIALFGIFGWRFTQTR